MKACLIMFTVLALLFAWWGGWGLDFARDIGREHWYFKLN